MCKNFEEGGKGPGGNNGAKWKRGKERRKMEKEMKKEVKKKNEEGKMEK